MRRASRDQRGLLEDDRHHNEALTEAAVQRSPSALGSLFAVILTMYEPSDPFQLWTAHQENHCEPLTRPTGGYFASIYRYGFTTGDTFNINLCNKAVWLNTLQCFYANVMFNTMLKSLIFVLTLLISFRQTILLFAHNKLLYCTN